MLDASLQPGQERTVNQTILDILKGFDFSIFQPIKPRSLDLGTPLQPKAGNLVQVIVGMRRSGKSYRLFQEMESLHEAGVPWSRICYFNFEDDRLDPVTPATGEEVLEAFEALHPGCFQEGVYLFLDEIQEMESWGKWLRRVSDTRPVTIYATGSSSKMLSTEIATGFRGRAIDHELLPLSFAESLTFSGLWDEASAVAYSSSERVLLQTSFNAYLETGGFPAVQELPQQTAISVLQSYVQRVVSLDVVERHNIARPRIPALFAQRLVGLNARQLSVRKIVNDLKSAGVPTSRELLSDTLAYFEEAYLLFLLRERSFSLAESSNHQPKVYMIDPGLALANARAHTNDAGQRLENAVFLELRRRAVGARKDAITSFKTAQHGYEIDFALGDALDEHPLQLFQVSSNVDDPKTLQRELRALWEGMEESGIEEAALIVNHGEETVHEEAGRRIRQVPAWKWFLQSEL